MYLASTLAQSTVWRGMPPTPFDSFPPSPSPHANNPQNDLTTRIYPSQHENYGRSSIYSDYVPRKSRAVSTSRHILATKFIGPLIILPPWAEEKAPRGRTGKAEAEDEERMGRTVGVGTTTGLEKPARPIPVEELSLEEELDQTFEKMGNAGFTNAEYETLVSYSVKPWDDDAADVLDALGYYN
ncbi:hypothetical protein EVG20_g10692 [Dentipellis fragilis]|uniref:Uncharacterized protein n=1 Tax=Dentipellis fragilis TaxID=205917 RepID=A0A4Y9XPR7_9AGAM|nr:hypothetical protein EVG20_g10692 [Dentipellis fragilis]